MGSEIDPWDAEWPNRPEPMLEGLFIFGSVSPAGFRPFLAENCVTGPP
jgi:hypothetical protein